MACNERWGTDRDMEWEAADLDFTFSYYESRVRRWNRLNREDSAFINRNRGRGRARDSVLVADDTSSLKVLAKFLVKAKIRLFMAASSLLFSLLLVLLTFSGLYYSSIFNFQLLSDFVFLLFNKNGGELLLMFQSFFV